MRSAHAWHACMQAGGLSGLSKLLFLDLSHNRISDLEPSNLPESIKFLKVRCWKPVLGSLTEQMCVHVYRVPPHPPCSTHSTDSLFLLPLPAARWQPLHAGPWH